MNSYWELRHVILFILKYYYEIKHNLIECDENRLTTIINTNVYKDDRNDSKYCSTQLGPFPSRHKTCIVYLQIFAYFTKDQGQVGYPNKFSGA